ncbi:hypothetical protein GC167_08645 [bacterium]|nr:hypothetical protein [bacterium]
MKKLVFSALVLCATTLSSVAQTSISSGGPAYTQNFDALGAPAATALPSDWRLGTTTGGPRCGRFCGCSNFDLVCSRQQYDGEHNGLPGGQLPV